MCGQAYAARRAAQVEIAQAMQSLGLRPDWRLADRRPQPADTFDGQMARIAMSGEVVRLVRLRMPITTDERHLLYRLVDHAMADRERQQQAPQASTDAAVGCDAETEAAFIVWAGYRSAGGTAPFKAWRRQWMKNGPEPEAAPPEAPVADPAPRPAPRPAPARRQRQAPPFKAATVPTVPLVIHVAGAAAHG